ncbi:hypothetical protein KJ997_05705 [bacterium]|nr:hypothetical protein [bacterium]
MGKALSHLHASELAWVLKADWSVPFTTFTMRVDIKDQKFKLTFSNIMMDQLAFRGDIEAIKPKLLGFGNQIVASMNKNKKSTDW